MKKLFLAVSHMHSQGIVHRDIKPENIMLDKQNELKLIDFGLATQLIGSKLTTVTGTPYYMAPEVFKGSYDSKCDTWALGCILYVFMCGRLPFNGKNQREVMTKIKSADYSLDYQEFKSCSSEVLDLIKQLLVADPEKRLSASEALNHVWFT